MPNDENKNWLEEINASIGYLTLVVFICGFLNMCSIIPATETNERLEKIERQLQRIAEKER